MSHKRKGQLTVSGEWARHLRPFLRRAFWKEERQAVRDFVREEENGVQGMHESRGTLENLLAHVEAIPPSATSIDLWVPEHLTLGKSEVSQDIAMAMLLDRLVARNLFPRGFRAEAGGRVYQYRSE